MIAHCQLFIHKQQNIGALVANEGDKDSILIKMPPLLHPCKIYISAVISNMGKPADLWRMHEGVL